MKCKSKRGKNMGSMILNGDSIALLKECDSGAKMATESLEQIMQYVSNSDMNAIIMKYNEDHIKYGEDIHEFLNEAGEQSTEPKPMAKAMSWVTTKIKMTLDGDTHEAASIIIDGCNMGIKSLNEYKNKYTGADSKSVLLCNRLIQIEKQLSDELQGFL
jgi:hypothetical protein